MFSLARRLIVTLAFLCGAVLLGALLAARTSDWPRAWYLEAIDTFAVFAFAPFAGVAVLALLCWSRALAVLTLAAALAFAQQFGTPFVTALMPPGSAAAAAESDSSRVRVLAYNLHAPNDDPAPLIAVVRELRPDVVVLQEVTTRFARAFDRAIGAEYPFSAQVAIEMAHEGSGTWSRWPLVEPTPFRMRVDSNVMHRARLATPAGDIWIVNVHLANPAEDAGAIGRLAALRRIDPGRRDAELADLARRVSNLDGPFVLAGDFNSAAGSSPYRAFPPTWQDAFGRVGRGFGHTYPSTDHERDELRRFPIPMPLIRIDYILTGGGIEAVRAWTISVPGSDHLAVVADLERAK